MTVTLLVTEGIDDLRALTEIITREFAYKTLKIGDLPPLAPVFSKKQARYFHKPDPGHLAIVLYAGNKDRAAERVKDELLQEANQHKIDSIGLVFDPDQQNDAELKQWLYQMIFQSVEDQGLNISNQELRYIIRSGEHDENLITFIPIPWDAGAILDELDSSQRCLERVALAVMQQVSSQDTELLLELLYLIQQKGCKTTWKTAFKLFNAIRKPSVEDGFVSQVFGQDKELRVGIEPVLRSSQLWERFSLLLGFPL